MLAYLKRCLAEAKTKLTVWLIAATGFIDVIPQFIQDYWSQWEKAVPHLVVYHQAVIVLGLVLSMWARVRRSVRNPAPAP